MSLNTIHIPDILRNWPWKRVINPHYDECKHESEAWAESFLALNPKAQKTFNRCNFSLLASLVYPKLNKGRILPFGCDVMNHIFLLDEWSEESDSFEMETLAHIIMDSLRNPHKPRPKGEWRGGEMTRQFWANAIEIATMSTRLELLKRYEEFSNAVIQQCRERDQKHIHTVDSYFKERRITAGVMLLVTVNRIQMNIPDEIFCNEEIQCLHNYLTDMIFIANDIYSYNVEQSRGDEEFNLVTVVMREHQLDLQSAYDWIGKYHDDLAAKFLDCYSKISSWGSSIDRDVLNYLDDLGNWVRANDQWSLESERYFGTDGLRVMKERTFRVLPKTEFVSIRPTSD